MTAARNLTPRDYGLPYEQVWHTEELFRDAVVRLAKDLGWTVFWTWNSRHSPDGEPDLRMFSEARNRIVFAELKRGGMSAAGGKQRRGTLSDKQREVNAMLGRLRIPGFESYVWYPEDYDRIVEVLS